MSDKKVIVPQTDIDMLETARQTIYDILTQYPELELLADRMHVVTHKI